MRPSLVTTLAAWVALALGGMSPSNAVLANAEKPQTMTFRPSPCVAVSGGGRTAAGDFSPSRMEFPLAAVKPSYWPSDVPPIRLNVQITDPSGKSFSHALSLAAMPGSCRAFFSSDGRYLAFGVSLHLGAAEWLNVNVFDTQASIWLKPFDVKAGPRLGGPFQFEGFLESSSSLVVTGVRNTAPATKDITVVAQLINLDGSASEANGSMGVAGPGMEYFIPDPGSNRLWIRGGQKGFCPLRAVTLTGPIIDGPTIDSSTLDGLVCGSPLDAVGFVGPNTIVGESVRQSTEREMQSWVWRVDLDHGTAEKIELPKPGFSLFTAWRDYRLNRNVSVSADGAVFAVGRSITNWAFDEPTNGPTQIAVVRVNPLTVLKIVDQRSCHDLGSFAVGHWNGSTTVLAYWCGQLQKTTLQDPK
jgi:hypothetical protein